MGSMKPERDRELWDMRQAGKTRREIGAHFGISVSRVHQIEAREWRANLMREIRRKRQEAR
jgi:DNA-directed RNA polymerase specialized sigma subunit